MAQLDRADVISALLKKGFIKNEKKDHIRFYFNHPKLHARLNTFISHGSDYKTLHEPIIQKMARQLHLSKLEFLEYVDCKMDINKYKSILVKLNILVDDNE